MTPRPTQKDGIMCAALGCFAERGYSATTIRAIARAAGVSEGALYRHFASKEDLARELYARGLETFARELSAAAEDAPDPLEGLRRMARRVLTGYREFPEAFAYGLLRTPPSAISGLTCEGELPVDVVARVIERGQGDGTVLGGQPRVLAAAFLGCLLQPIAMSRATPACVPDLLADDTNDATLVEAAVGAVRMRRVSG